MVVRLTISHDVIAHAFINYTIVIKNRNICVSAKLVFESNEFGIVLFTFHTTRIMLVDIQLYFKQL